MHYCLRRIVSSVLLLCMLLSCVACTNRNTTKREGTFRPRPVADEVVAFEGEHEDPVDAPFAVTPLLVTADRVCYGEEGTDSSVVMSVNTSLLTLPRWIREAFLTSGWEMCVVPYDIATEDYDDQFEEGQVYGSTSYKNHTIKILNDIKAAANSPIHEFGHWLDAQLGYSSLYSDDFLQLYEDEGELYRSTFGPTCSWDAHEFIAEGFWCYWKSPRALSRACPGFYSFIETSLDSLKEVYIAEPVS